MSLTNVFKTTTGATATLDGSTGDTSNPTVSDFLTVQSFANFSAMTGAITAAWKGLQIVFPQAASQSVPFAFALAWAIISVLISWDSFQKSGKVQWGTVVQALFLALINALVLASAIVGAGTIVNGATTVRPA